MKIGDDTFHDVVFVAWSYYDLRGGVQGIASVGIHPPQNSLQCIGAVDVGALVCSIVW